MDIRAGRMICLYYLLLLFAFFTQHIGVTHIAKRPSHSSLDLLSH